MKLRHLFFACYGVFVIMFSLLLLVVIVFSDEEDGGSSGNLIYGGVSVSQEVLAHKPMLEKYAREYGIEEYLNVLLAIIQVESGGTLEDVMQSSESLGLPPNSLSTEESIKQGCKYFSELLAAAETKGCDLNSVIQSYNYGGGFLDYVTGRGKKYTFELAESFARDKSGGKKVTYTNPVAVEKNGGWRYSFGGMGKDAKEHLSKTFHVKNNEMVVEKDIVFYSTCEHHLLPFYGKAHVAYIPDGKVVGLSKLARTVEVYAKRPQMQEQLTAQIADALMEHLKPQGAMVMIEAEHMCMTMRGIKKPGSRTVTYVTRGIFEKDTELQNRFFQMVR